MQIRGFIFLVSIIMCFYVYFGYALLLWILGQFFKKPINRDSITPTVTVIIAARNEENVIAKKISNLLTQDYPQENLEIIVASDGSSDRTEEIARSYKEKVKVISLLESGKAHAINEAVAVATGEILVLTDANAIFEQDALAKIVQDFQDPNVGGVCGNQLHSPKDIGDASGKGERMYWGYDKWIKTLESDLGSIVSADGSIYAIRKSLFVPIEDPAQADDMAISGRVVTQGYRLTFNSEAISYEDAPQSSEKEFARKIRITNHSLRAILLLKALNPFRYGFYSIVLFSHKVLRYLIPFFLIGGFISNVFLARSNAFYKTTMILQILFYGCAIGGYVLKDSKWGKIKCFVAPLYFCLSNIAAFYGVLTVIRGKRITRW